MSVFSPLDPRGPDQRRKQLIAKLAAQAGANGAAVNRIPLPGKLGAATTAEGRSFRGASTSRAGGQTHTTQSPNILASVLAQLGVVGKSHAEEMSPGQGLPIARPVPGVGAPIPPQGSAIPTPNGPPGASGLQAGPAPTQVTGPGQVIAPSAGGLITPGGGYMPDTESLITGQGAVPLGNGLYYDPSTGSILGQQDVNPSIQQARVVRGGASAF